MQCVYSILLLLPLVLGITFVPPSEAPLSPSPNYGGPSNTTLPKSKIVKGKVFDRIMTIIYENTDFKDAAAVTEFKTLAKQGIVLTNYHGLTHTSESNYVAMAGGSFWGMYNDNWYNVPENISTIVDLLEEKDISWAEYQEGMATDGDGNFGEFLPNYVNTSAPPYEYYYRKHNPLIIYDSVANVPSRAARIRNFNDLGRDVNASALPQFSYTTPNIMNDGHDTNPTYAGGHVGWFVLPLLENPKFNNPETLFVLTFDEDATDGGDNTVWTILAGGAVPEHLRGTTDDTYYTHYSLLSTVEANWGLGCLGRGDTNKTLANVFSFVADQIGYQNVHIPADATPFTNISRTIPGPFNPEHYVPFPLPDLDAKCPGGGKVFVSPLLNLTRVPQPAPVNLTAIGAELPGSGPPTTLPVHPSTTTAHPKSTSTRGRPTPTTTSRGHNQPSTSSGHHESSTSSGHHESSTSSGHHEPSTSSKGHPEPTTSSHHESTTSSHHEPTTSSHHQSSTSSHHESSTSSHHESSTSSHHQSTTSSTGHPAPTSCPSPPATGPGGSSCLITAEVEALLKALGLCDKA